MKIVIKATEMFTLFKIVSSEHNLGQANVIVRYIRFKKERQVMPDVQTKLRRKPVNVDRDFLSSFWQKKNLI